MKENILQSWFIQGMVKATNDMWLKGWDERNGGNVSLRIDATDIEPYAASLRKEPFFVALEEARPELANHYFMITGSGKFFRNVILNPEENLVLIQLNDNGTGYNMLWGLKEGERPTSELPTHLESHGIRKASTDGKDRVIMHCHATNLIALTYVLEPNAALITRELWEMSTECLVVFPDGVGIVPWMVPGTTEIGNATAEIIPKHSLVLWAFHGIFGSGPTLDDTFGLIDTAEKSAEILVKVLSMGGRKQSITTAELRDLAKRFDVTPMESALSIR